MAHAVYLIQMFETSLDMLGPDIELLTEMMSELGAKHVRYGVRTEMYGMMGDALIESLKELLGEEKINPKVERAWHETFDALVEDMRIIHLQQSS